MTLVKYAVLAALATGLGIWAWQTFGPGESDGRREVVVGQLSSAAVEGKAAFDVVCAACHGVDAAGSDKGPPLVHEIYNPGHHPDQSFFRAAKLGTRQHHWRFGDMPPQPEVSEDQVAAIVRYVRELQAANGIGTRPHTM